MSDYLLQIAHKEGYQAYLDKVYCMDCPYEGVSLSLKESWENGWWDGFYEEIE